MGEGVVLTDSGGDAGPNSEAERRAGSAFQHKRGKKDPIAVFSLKDPNTIVVKLKRTNDTIDFLMVDRRTYQISMDQLDDCVQACLDKGLLIVPVTEQVETALSYDPQLPFKEEFKKTELYGLEST